jgi:hypothetical protein
MATLLGTALTREDVDRALTIFDAAYPDSGDYDNWLVKRNYKYALRRGGRLYPPKKVLSLASGAHVRRVQRWGRGRESPSATTRL